MPEARHVPGAVRDELVHIAQGGKLSPRMLSMLQFIVEETLAGRGGSIDQLVLGERFFGIDANDIKQLDNSVVRVTATRMRKALADYYRTAGRSRPLRLGLTARYKLTVEDLNLNSDPRIDAWLNDAKAARNLRTLPGYKEALGYLTRVMKIAPGHPEALALKAEIYATRCIYGLKPRPDLQRAEALASECLARDSTQWTGHVADAAVKATLYLNWQGAGEAFRQAIHWGGDEAEQHPWHTAFLMSQGRAAEAIRLAKQAVNHGGYESNMTRADLADMQILGRDYRGARETIDALIRHAPGFYLAHVHRAILCEATGDLPGAVAALDATPLPWHQIGITLGLKALFRGLNGQRQSARRRASFLERARRIRYVPASQIAIAWLGAGDHDRAVFWLEESLNDRDPLLLHFALYPFLRHLHGHSGFRALISKIGPDLAHVTIPLP